MVFAALLYFSCICFILYLFGDAEQYEDVGVEDDPTGADDDKVHGAQQEYLRELAVVLCHQIINQTMCI